MFNVQRQRAGSDAETTYMIEVERLFHFSSVRYILIIDVKDIQWSFTHHVIVRIWLLSVYRQRIRVNDCTWIVYIKPYQ